MKFKLVLLFIVLFAINVNSQVNSGARQFYYNLMSECPDTLILDKVVDPNLSFGYSLRKLRAAYTGNCMRIRRGSDNLEADIPFTTSDYMDTNFLKTFLNGAQGFVTTWYDQSGLNRHATNSSGFQQPEFKLNAINGKPGIYFDGTNDYLRLNVSILTVTNNGLEGSLFMLLNTTSRSQTTFGVIVSNNRWSIHANWNNGSFYFDPGYCCNPSRSFINTSGNSDIFQYSMIRGTNYAALRKEGVSELDTAYLPTATTVTSSPCIGAGGTTTSGIGGYSECIYQELIMFKTDIVGTKRTTLEQDQISFW